MSLSCNFVNSFMAATRCRSSSVTPSQRNTKKDSPLDNLDSISSDSRRATSLNNLSEKNSESKSHGGNLITNHVMGDSTGTILDATMQSTSSQISAMDQEIDDNDEELKEIMRRIRFTQQCVEGMERDLFGPDVPRTLVDGIINHVKNLRVLKARLFEISLESPAKVSKENLHEIHVIRRPIPPVSPGRNGSHIRPGQENTADILDAIPPSGSLQHQQYLTKASSGTDSNGYSQLPMFAKHKHPLNISPQTTDYNDDSYSICAPLASGRVCLVRSGSHNLGPNIPTTSQEQIQKLDLDRARPPSSARHTTRRSPIRPNHIDCNHRTSYAVMSSDSSSTHSNESPN